MNVLSIGSDRKLFDPQSAVAKRTILYGKKMGNLSVIVFTLRSQGFAPIKLSPEVTIYPTMSINRLMYIFDAIRIGKKVVVENKFVRGESVVTCQDPFESGLVGWRIARHFRLPLHLQLHTDFLSPYFATSLLQQLRVVLGKFLLPKADGVRVVSERIATSLTQHHVLLKKAPQVLPIRITIPEIELSSEKKNLFPQFSFVIYMASRLEKEKRIEDALTAFSLLVKQFPKVGLVIAGDGSQMNKLKARAQSLGIVDSVVFLGWIEDVAQYFDSAHVFLSTSEYEGYGMSIVEAGLRGVPVVSTSVGVAGELLVNERNSYLCPVGDTMCIMHSLADLVTHNEKRHVLSMALREDVLSRIPSLDQYIDDYTQGVLSALRA